MTVYRWVRRFTPLLVDAARPCRHRPAARWFVDETYVRVAARWTYLYKAIDQYGQVIDVLASVISMGHALVQNIRRGHYELGVDEPMTLRVVAAFDELVLAI
jgi:hypothetical protein